MRKKLIDKGEKHGTCPIHPRTVQVDRLAHPPEVYAWPVQRPHYELTPRRLWHTWMGVRHRPFKYKFGGEGGIRTHDTLAGVESPWVSWRLGRLDLRGDDGLALTMVVDAVDPP